MDIYSYNLKIDFSDVGENNRLSNKGILRIMQEVAGLNSDAKGYGLNDTPRTGLAWLILNWKLKVFSRPKWNTSLIVKTWTRSENPLFSYRDLEMYDNENNLVAIATSKWILFDVNKETIIKLSKEVQESFNCIDKNVFNEKVKEKLKEPENSNFVYEYKIQRRDIDTNHHVNNINYLDYAYEALPEDVYSSMNFSNIEIMYKHEAKLGDIISVFYSHNENNKHIITIKDQERKNIHAIIKLYN